MKYVQDSVHEHIELSDLATELIATPQMQRLRRIKQLGTVSLVYPSANHTRFEHSLGVYQLAQRALNHLDGVPEPEQEVIEAAALLHDIGHTPYSHNVESVLERHVGKSHDDVIDLLKGTAIEDVLDRYGISTQKVGEYIAGEHKYGQLVSGELDVDRMDYLVRDAYHTGVPYGTIDTSRLVRELTFVDGDLTFRAGNVQAAESLLIARALMTPVVYTHRTAQVSKSMLEQATERLVQEGEFDAEQLREMDDYDLIVMLRQHTQTEEIARRLDERDLFKGAVRAELQDVAPTVLNSSFEEIQEYETEVAALAGAPVEQVIVDVPPSPSMKETTTKVVVNGERRSLDEQSPLVDALRASQTSQWRLGVYSPEEIVPDVQAAAERVLLE